MNFLNLDEIILNWNAILISAAFILAALSAGLITYFLLTSLFSKWSRKTPTELDDLIFKKLKKPLRLLLPIFFLFPALSRSKFPEEIESSIRHIIALVIILGLSWMLIGIVGIIKEFLLKHFNIKEKDNLQARSVYTQVSVMERIIVSVIFIVTISAMLMTFEEVRKTGMSILASAGIMGIIAGLAAQKSISALFAGIQIAITQPFRIDDVVIVEGEWGRIEEITLTYVVVKIWDERRLVLPITYFLEKPFQNWTRTTSDLLGTVFIYADYSIPVQIIRSRLEEFLKKSKLWDGRVCSLQVTNLKDSTVELRALMSSRDASDSWDLRCEIREKLLEYIQKEFPEKLPKIRLEMNRQNEA